MKVRSLLLLAAAVALGVTLVPARRVSGQGSSSALTLLSRDGRRAIPTTMAGESEVVALDDLATIFQLSVREESGAITVSYKGKTIVLTPDQALASVAGRLISLPAPPVRAGRRWMVPVEFIGRALALIYDTRLDLRKSSHLVVLGELRVPRLAIRYDAAAGSARLTIDATPRATSTVSQDNERVLVKFDADALDVPALPAIQSQGLVQGIRAADAVTLAVELGARFSAFRAAAQSLESASRLVIDFVAAQSEAPPAPGATPSAGGSSPIEPPQGLGQPAPAIRVIVIDPGHGGDDEGVKGSDGTKEKDLTLAVARRLKSAIEARLGIRVLLTHEDDRNVPLDDRAALANNNKADLFISLHADASLRKTTAGASIFSAAFEKDAEQAARSALVPERLPAFGGGSRDIELVPWDLAQIAHVADSAELARIIGEQCAGRVALGPLGVDRAPLRVLASTNMPAVLMEMGYLSNADQAKQLATPDFQAAVTQVLFDSVLKFRDYLGTRRASPTAMPGATP